MDLHNNNKINGLNHYLLVGQHARVDELNNHIGDRHFPDVPLEPNFAPRSVSTKYSLFPIINRRTPEKEYALPYPTFNTNNFYPGTQNGPSSGYFHNIQDENQLRNQHVKNQRGIPEHIHIPDSNSDLYKDYVVSRPSDQPHPDLFYHPKYQTSQQKDILSTDIGKQNIFNHTRTQLRNSN